MKKQQYQTDHWYDHWDRKSLNKFFDILRIFDMLTLEEQVVINESF